MPLQGVYDQAGIAGIALPDLTGRDFSMWKHGETEAGVSVNGVDAFVG
jgi:hypothetical protein